MLTGTIITILAGILLLAWGIAAGARPGLIPGWKRRRATEDPLAARLAARTVRGGILATGAAIVILASVSAAAGWADGWIWTLLGAGLLVPPALTLVVFAIMRKIRRGRGWAWPLAAACLLAPPLTIGVALLILRSTGSLPLSNKQAAVRCKPGEFAMVLGTTLLPVALALFLALSAREPAVEATGRGIRISGQYGEMIPQRHITEIGLTDSIPHIDSRRNGFEIGSIRKGYFELAGWGRVKLFLESGQGPYIKITTTDNRIVLLNRKNPSATLRLFRELSPTKTDGK